CYSNRAAAPGRYAFPYTTLFRSPTVRGARRSAARRLCRAYCFVTRILPEKERSSTEDAPELDVPAKDFPSLNWKLKCCEGKSFADRKSTRLNSSHDQNSYAVFCL